jgi:hypothetical protein
MGFISYKYGHMRQKLDTPGEWNGDDQFTCITWYMFNRSEIPGQVCSPLINILGGNVGQFLYK